MRAPPQGECENFRTSPKPVQNQTEKLDQNRPKLDQNSTFRFDGPVHVNDLQKSTPNAGPFFDFGFWIFA
jgi:hypothetical protein